MKKQKIKTVGVGPVSAQNAITLISLIITIIILLILAGVTINLTIGNNGIFSTAQKAAKNYTEAQNKELANLNEFENIVDKVTQAPAYNPTLLQLKPGDYVKYDTGVKEVGDNGVVTFRVLYDATSEYGLQIISDKNLENVTLGGDDWATAKASYNEAITILNDKAMQYKNSKYAIDARCVGSNPTNKNAEGIEFVELQFITNIEGAKQMKNIDSNYTVDQTAMEKATLLTTGTTYWLASRNVLSSLNYCGFIVRSISNDGSLYDNGLCSIRSDGNIGLAPDVRGLRPCIVLKPDICITSGNGLSELTAYTLGI